MASKTENNGNQINGELGFGVAAKDIILAIIAKFGIDMGTGHIVEYTGEAIRNLTMEERMTICNMSIEAGARAGLISPDETTVELFKRSRTCSRQVKLLKKQQHNGWHWLLTKEQFTIKQLKFDADEIEPFVTWGTNPSMGSGISQPYPTYNRFYEAESDKEALKKHLLIWDLKKECH